MLRVLLLACLVTCSLGAALLPRRPRLEGKIVGGRPVYIEDFPYQVSLEYGGRHICGGSIISSSRVLTAAHCVDGASASNVRIRAGSTFTGTGGKVVYASWIRVHPDYDYYNIDYDIAVIEISDYFNYETGVQPISLTYAEPPPRALAVVSGWGKLSQNTSSVPLQLQAVEVNIIPRPVCNSAYILYGGITENMICAGVNGGGRGPCQGDDGGPLVVDNNLVGIVSWGVGCEQSNYPAVYTNVAVFWNFINYYTAVA